jgi:hypothetical protein
VGKSHYIEFYSNSDNDIEDEGKEQEQGHQESSEETSQAGAEGPVMASMSRLPRYHTF